MDMLACCTTDEDRSDLLSHVWACSEYYQTGTFIKAGGLHEKCMDHTQDLPAHSVIFYNVTLTSLQLKTTYTSYSRKPTTNQYLSNFFLQYKLGLGNMWSVPTSIIVQL